VATGKYTLTLHFIERRVERATRQQSGGSSQRDAGPHPFNVFCNGKAIVRDLDVIHEAGENRPLVRRITGLEPNAQGKLMLEFVPVTGYATVTAIEVVPQ